MRYGEQYVFPYVLSYSSVIIQHIHMSVPLRRIVLGLHPTSIEHQQEPVHFGYRHTGRALSYICISQPRLLSPFTPDAFSLRERRRAACGGTNTWSVRH